MDVEFFHILRFSAVTSVLGLFPPAANLPVVAQQVRQAVVISSFIYMFKFPGWLIF